MTTAAPASRASRTASRTDGTMSRTTRRPLRLSRSQTIEPGVVAPTIAILTPLRVATAHALESLLPVRLKTFAAKKRKRGLAHRALERGQAVVEFVIADCGRVVLHRVHRDDHRMRHRRIDARGHVRERVSLEHVAGVDDDGQDRGRAPKRVDDRGDARQAAQRVRAISVVIPTADVAVDIGRRGNDEVDCRSRLVQHRERARSGQERGDNEKHSAAH